MSNEQISSTLHAKIIDIILSSPLNIESIPDDVEREMYEQIFKIIVEFGKSDKGKSYGRSLRDLCVLL